MSDNKAALSAFRKEVAAWMGENVPAATSFLNALSAALLSLMVYS